MFAQHCGSTEHASNGSNKCKSHIEGQLLFESNGYPALSELQIDRALERPFLQIIAMIIQKILNRMILGRTKETAALRAAKGNIARVVSTNITRVLEHHLRHAFHQSHLNLLLR